METLKKFGIDLSKSHLLPIALTHTSYANEHNCVSYERLEFLGDAVLELVSSDYIYKSKRLTEGEMSKKRSLYVCENALFEYSKELNLASYIKVGNSVRYPNKTVVADVFEAVIGVIYLELGLNTVTKFFDELIVPYIERNVDFLNDYKKNTPNNNLKKQNQTVIMKTIFHLEDNIKKYGTTLRYKNKYERKI